MMKYFTVTLLAALCFAQPTAEPWTKAELLEPAAFAQELQSGKTPTILSVAFPVLYRNRHLPGAIDVGPGNKPEGVALLRKTLEKLPKDADIVVYCGCCPMDRCPNLRPAYRTLKQMGYKNVRVLSIPTNMHTDWYTKNYPSEPGSPTGK